MAHQSLSKSHTAVRTYVAVPCVQSVAKNELGLRLILFHNVKQLAIAEMECSTHGTLCF